MLLKEVFFDLFNRLPQNFDDDSVSINAEEFKLNLSNFNDNESKIIVGTRMYHPSPDIIDWVCFYFSFECYKYFGLLLLSSIFNNKKLTLNLENQKSDVKRIIIDTYNKNLCLDKLQIKPLSFEYIVEEFNSSTLYDAPLDTPSFYYVFKDEDFILKKEDHDKRDTLYINGSFEAIGELANIFLNLSVPKQKVSEFYLERPVGFGGVSNLSAEVRIYTENNVNYISL